MIIKKITLENIRSYKHQEIEFPEGSVLLSGDIGSGKTTVLLGIEFALFGLQPGQRGSSLLRNGEKQAEVIMEFAIGDMNVIIERSLKKGKTVTQDYCSITINGEKKEMSVTEIKNKVLELLNYSQEFSKKQNILYKFTVYTPQEEMKQIILEDPTTRMNTLRHVFGIDKYKKILENVSLITLKMREERRVREGLTANLETDKEELNYKKNELKSKRDKFSSAEKEFSSKTEIRKKIQEEKEELSKKIEERVKLRQEIEKTKIMVLNKKDTISSNEKLITQLKEQIGELQKLTFDEKEITQVEEELAVLKKEILKLNENNLKVNSQINSLDLKNEDIRELEKKISNLEICPTCLQDVDSVYRTNVLNKLRLDMTKNNKMINELKQEREKISEKLNNLNKETTTKEKKINELKILKIKLQEVYNLKNRLEDVENMNLLLRKDISLLEKHIETLKQSIFELNKYESLFQSKQKELDESLEQERFANIRVAELKKEIELFLAQIESLESKIKQTEEIRKQLVHIIELENWLSKKFISVINFIEKNVMIKLKSEFSSLFSEWFSILVSDSFDVRLADDFTPIIEQQDYEIGYQYLSGGERTAIALAYRLSLNQVINSFLSTIKTKDIVILDEPTDGFSEQQLDKMRDVLQQLNVRQLIIVSHEQKIEGFVENVIKFKKERGVSVME